MNKVTCYDAKVAAQNAARNVRCILERDSARVSPGQWDLANILIDRVYVDAFTQKCYRTSDYL